MNHSALSVPAAIPIGLERRVLTGYSVSGLPLDREAADLIRARLGEPQRAVGAVGDRERLRVTGEVELRERYERLLLDLLDAPDRVRPGVGHPHVAVRSERDGHGPGRAGIGNVYSL